MKSNRQVYVVAKLNHCDSDKLQAFCEIAGLFNYELDSTPILYGSLGLAQHIPHAFDQSDIDMLVEQRIFDIEVERLPKMMASIGFRLVNIREQDYVRSSLRVGIASDGDLFDFAGIDPQILAVESVLSCQYRVLSLNDYLRAYEASSLDGYRKDAREKNDRRKLELIREELGMARQTAGNSREV